MIPPWAQYMEDVITGKRLAGRLEKLCVERCVRLAQKDKYFLDLNEIERVLSICKILRHTKGEYAKKPFELMPWQEFFLAMLFGMKRKADNTRLFRKALLCVAKKNGKSEFAAAIGVIMTYFDGEEGAECYSAANKYDQAKICWDAAAKMCKFLKEDSKVMDQRIKMYNSTNNKSLRCMATDSIFKPIASDSKTLDGINVYFGVIDEYHEAKDDSVTNNIESATVARRQPLLLITTTRGFRLNGVLHQLEKAYTLILEGELENDEVFPLIYSMDDGDDWNDVATWEKANPGLGQTPTVKGLMSEYQKAKTEGSSREINFKTKSLNMWVATSSTWAKDEDFMACVGDWDEQELDGAMCFAGLDLAKTRDITAIAYLFPPQLHWKEYRVVMRYYVPEENAVERSRRDQVPYLDWAKKGNIKLTPGNVADYDYIMTEIQNAGKVWDIRGISYDPWNATSVATKLSEQDLPMNEFRQTTTKFNEPICAMEKVILMHQLDHRGDPVLRWMCANITPYYDGNNNVKFDKGRSAEKIDGMVALAMAFDEFLVHKIKEVPDFDVIWN